MKIAFVTNVCAHYRVKTFETLAEQCDVDYYFFSQGEEWYTLQQHARHGGKFNHVYLPGFRVGRQGITPTLISKLLITPYDIYIKCINGRFALPAAYLIARLRRKPFILWTGTWMRLQTPMWRLLLPLIIYLYRHADAIVVYGEHVKQYLISEGVQSNRIFVTTHAIDNEIYSRQVSEADQKRLRDELDIAMDQKIVLFMGRFSEEKGVQYLITAFAEIEDSRAVLVMAGTGEEENRLRKLASELGIAHRIRWAGYVPPTQVPEYQAATWVCVVPSITTSRFKEPWSLVVNEAFAQGVPVIATDAVGSAVGGLIQDGINGMIVPERDAEALVQAINSILADDSKRNQMGAAARSKIAGWTNERMVQGFLDAINYVIRT